LMKANTKTPDLVGMLYESSHDLCKRQIKL